MNFEQALQTGRVVLRRTFPNRSNPKQTTCQFFQLKDVPSTGGSNKLVAIAQGIENAGKNHVSALFSVNTDVLTNQMGLSPDHLYYEDETAIFADDMFNMKTNIIVRETTQPNSYVNEHFPKINPRTQEVQCVEGNAIYRHTFLAEADADFQVPNEDFLYFDEQFEDYIIEMPDGSMYLKVTDTVPSTLDVDTIENRVTQSEGAAA